ncbi:MAG: asparagine synthase C-terminal domain-containing protein [Balneolaceae bacterium]|nr:asparagine synthase C-terminal domain-containing protein [Balneolaceae bacterium]
MQSRLPSNVPVGSHCSGGIDSTLVTIMSSKALQERGSNLAAAYTWSPAIDENYQDMGAPDERRVIISVCNELRVPLRFGEAKAGNFEELIAQQMELQGTANLMDELSTIRQAQNDGIGVMLSGWGGDEAFSSHGHGHTAWLLRNGRVQSIIKAARRVGGKRRPFRVASYLWRDGIVPLLPEMIYEYFNPYHNLFPEGAFPSPKMRALYASKSMSKSMKRIKPNADLYMRQMIKNGHLAERMATWSAWSVDAGFEYRYPLVDRDLLEFLLSLPHEIRFGYGAGRYFAKHSFKSALPKGINKYDSVNEKLRLENRLAWLKMLSMDAQEGRFEQACKWLNMAKLRADLVHNEPSNKTQIITKAARLLVALRIQAMELRN